MYMCYSSHFKDTLTLENQPFFKMEILIFDTHQQLSNIISPFQFTQHQLLIYARKNLWHRVLEANKEQVPLTSYSLEIRIDSVNQILKSKEKIK